jgi:membrane dipeptidase
MRIVVYSLIAVGLFFSCRSREKVQQTVGQAEPGHEEAAKMASRILVLDTHIDVPNRLRQNRDEDLSARTAAGNFDYPRARSGGLDAAFMSIYIPASFQEMGGARAFADDLIDMVQGFEERWPEKFRIAKSVSDVRANFREGVISLALGMENGAGIEDRIENLVHFYDRGVRYITLTHSRANRICDSSYDTKRQWNGISPFGRDVVLEMNRLGIMVDVSHVTDEAFYQILEISKAPVIASHSSCRHFTPGWERNMSDEMIRALASQKGVIQINFGSMFLNDHYRTMSDPIWEKVLQYVRENGLEEDDSRVKDYADELRREADFPVVDVSEIVSHIRHVVDLVGVDHVGLGSDFDGVGDHLPVGMEDVSKYPNLIYGLISEGFAEEEIRKICAENLLRVWGDVERVSGQMQ